MWNLITLNGYFEGNQNWDLSFHESIWGEELEQLSLEQLHSADYLIFGRVTYEGMAAYWKESTGEIADLMNKIPKIVVSKTLQTVDWNNTTLISKNVSEEIKKIQEQGNGDMYVFGSAKLSESLIKDKLFDEYRIAIAPVMLSDGRALFEKGISAQNLSLISSRQLKNGGVILKYKN